MQQDVKILKGFLKLIYLTGEESDLTESQKISLNLFVAYDLNYANTKSTDYTNINSQLLDMVDHTSFIGKEKIQGEIIELIQNQIITEKQSKLIFGRGYSAKRNIILYMALKENIDYLLFLDDDEYPVAVTENSVNCNMGWSTWFANPFDSYKGCRHY